MNKTRSTERVFKTAWFSRAARKTLILDDDLCSAIRQVMLGQGDDLGGGVYKKRLRKNLYRSIIVAKGARYWIFVYLFAKKDLANISRSDLKDFRDLADLFARKSGVEVQKDLLAGELLEICHENFSEV